MLIEVLYVPGCPNYPATVRRVEEVLRGEALETPIHEVAVADQESALTLKFPGSPTVRINGEDAEPTTGISFGLACRLYADGAGVPSVALLSRAIARARQATGDEGF